MLLAFAALAGVTIALLLIAIAVLPKESFATVGFRLTFDGAEQDKLPNGHDFSTAEIIATPVLTEVFKANSLERYMRFEEFKQSMFILQENLELDMLSSEYQAKLADTKLTPVDRARVEEEFRRRREALKSASYTLNFHRAGRALRVPSELMGKTLNDTLSTWAQQASDRRGATLYDVPVVTRRPLDPSLMADNNHIVAVDVMQTQVERALNDIGELAKIPGAGTVTVGEEPGSVSIATLRTRLEDLQRFQLQPLLGALVVSGIGGPSGMPRRYLEDRFLDLRLQREESAERQKSLQDAMRGYSQRNAAAPGAVPSPEEPRGGVVPQLGESFLNRLLELSSESTDVTYRQDLTRRIIAEGIRLAELNRKVSYYDTLVQSIRPSALGSLSPALAAAKRRAFDELTHAMTDVGKLYEGISEQALNPNGVLYAITSPLMIHRASALGVKRAATYFIAVLFVGMILIPTIVVGKAFVEASARPDMPGTTREAADDGSGPAGPRGA